MDLASGKIELSERYIQKLKCGHTLQSYNAVVLWRNNGIGTPSVTAANVKMVDHAVWVLTTGKSCLQPCFPRSFESCIFLWTWHPERLSYQSVTSRNSSAVTHCRVITPLFYGETTVLERQV